MARYYWAVGKKADKEIRARVIDRLVERHERNWETYEDAQAPLLDAPQGRELLQFYRSCDLTWWVTIVQSYPDHARFHAKRYAALVKKYGAAPQPQVAA